MKQPESKRRKVQESDPSEGVHVRERMESK